MSTDTTDRAGPMIARGVGWKLTTQIVAQGSGLVVAVILARLLNPVEFGVAALAIVFTPLVYVLAEFGGSQALVQMREPTEDDRSTVFWMSAAMGAVAALAGIALAGPIASFFGEPQVKPLFMVLSATFVLTAITTVPSALLHRTMAFRSMEAASIASVLCGAAVGIAVAVTGGGAWAIIIQQVTISIVDLALLWLASGWCPRFRFSMGSARNIVRFSGSLTAAGLFSYVQKNVDNILVGRVLGAGPLGIYSVAYNLMLNPANRIAGPIYMTLFPIFSRMQDDDERIALIWLRTVRLTAAVVVPGMVGLVILAPEFVLVVLGAKWEAMVPVIQILACGGIVYALNTITYGVLLAKGLTGKLLRYSVIGTAMTVCGILAGLGYGVTAVAAGVAAGAVLQWPLYTNGASRALGISLGRYWRNLTPVMVATVAMAAVLIPVRRLLTSSDLGELPVFLACIAVGTCRIRRRVPAVRRRAARRCAAGDRDRQGEVSTGAGRILASELGGTGCS